MYSTLLVLHSLARWLVLACMLYSIFRALTGHGKKRAFSKTDNAFRHWTATAAHIQLMIGIILYTQSPVARLYWSGSSTGLKNFDFTFFAVIHIILMLTAIVLLTIGSALAKRKTSDREKFRTILTWFSLALAIILIAIPWPFSPLSTRPFFRTF